MTDAKSSRTLKSKLAKLLPQHKPKSPLSIPSRQDNTSPEVKHKGEKPRKVLKFLKDASRRLTKLASSKIHTAPCSSLSPGPARSPPTLEDRDSVEEPSPIPRVDEAAQVLVCAAEEAEAIEDGDHGLVNSPVCPFIEGTTFVLSETESTTFTQGVSYVESASSSEVLSSSKKWSEESVTNSTISSPFDGSCHGFQEKSDDAVANFVAGSEVGIIFKEAFQAIHDSGVGWSFEGLSAESETSSVLNDEVKEAREEASKENSSFHDALRELASNHELRFEDIVSRMAMFKKNSKIRDVPTRDVHLEKKSQRCLVEQAISLYEMPSRTEVAYPNAIRPLITPPFPNPTPSRIPIRVGRDRALTRRGINGAVGGFTTGESADGHRKVQAPQGHDCGRDHRRRVSSTVSTSSSSARNFDVPTQEQYLAARRAGWRL